MRIFAKPGDYIIYIIGDLRGWMFEEWIMLTPSRNLYPIYSFNGEGFGNVEGNDFLA